MPCAANPFSAGRDPQIRARPDPEGDLDSDPSLGWRNPKADGLGEMLDFPVRINSDKGRPKRNPESARADGR